MYFSDPSFEVSVDFILSPRVAELLAVLDATPEFQDVSFFF
jgi:hypothetical protein